MVAYRARGLVAACTLLALGCEVPRADSALPGEPFPSLSDAQRQEFAAGRASFVRTFTPAEGVGPTFNEPRCASCHDLPTIGGAGADAVRKVSRFVDGRCDLLVEHGGDMLQSQMTEALREHGFEIERVPVRATASTSLMAPALYGAGLVETVPDAVILAGADPEDANGDGISGKPGVTADGRIGRFGWKAGFASIRDFVGNAFLGEMGLTSVAFPHEESISGHSLPPESDPVPDPELDAKIVDEVVQYVRLLAPPAPDPASAATLDSLVAGRRVFDGIGCADCHTPEVRSGNSDVEALRQRRVSLYSDLLLHDMGPENASICAAGAAPSEWRTMPLMGLRLRVSLWHDGRAQSIEGAIRAHGGEAANARDRFSALAQPDRNFLLRFLASL
jgi:CxxC motif-containing protein (DUF1111 family)